MPRTVILREDPFAERPKGKHRRSPKRAGQTAMRHARRCLPVVWPGSRVQEAGAQVRWIPAGGTEGGLRPISRGEDLLGVFDALAWGPRGLLCVQVTTRNPGSSGPSGAAWSRRRRILDFVEAYGWPPAGVVVEVWAWEPRRHFHRWRLEAQESGKAWRKLDPMKPPPQKSTSGSGSPK